MRAIVLRALIGGLLPLVTVAGAAAETPVTLTVRLYNASDVQTDALAASRDTAESILRDAGLNVRFRECGRTTDSCDRPLAHCEVVVRIIAAPPFNATLDPDAYGVTYIVKNTNRGWLATVFGDRISAAATRASVDPGTLLGRVMAHEIGHLLLGLDYHGSAGLMRAAWLDDTLDRDAQNWLFSMAEAQRMKQVLASFGSFGSFGSFDSF